MSQVRARLREQLDERPLVLDGATGTELERLGASTTLPLWSATALWECPRLLEGVHRSYAEAGVDLLTANTFRTHRRSLASAGLGSQAAELTRRAVQIARRAAQTVGARAPLVLGSAAPLEDCYRPDLVPDDRTLVAEHAEHVNNLQRAGVDAILFETLNTVREARVATHAANNAELPFLVSFVCKSGGQLLSGEPLESALEATLPHSPLAVAVNCLPASKVEDCLPILRGCGQAFGVYVNLGTPDEKTGFSRNQETSADDLGRQTQRWLDAGARLVGGCCGTTPAHLRAVVATVREREKKVR